MFTKNFEKKVGIAGKKNTDCDMTYFLNNYYLSDGSLKGIGSETDESGICDCFTKSGSVCNVSNNLTVGAYTGKDVVQLMNAWVNANTLNFSELSTNPLKKWKYDASGNIGFDE